MQMEIRDKLQTKREDYRKKIRKEQKTEIIKGARETNNVQALRTNINLLGLFIDTPLGINRPDEYHRYLTELKQRLTDQHLSEAELDIINGCNLCLSLNHIVHMKIQPMLDVALEIQASLTGYRQYLLFELPEEQIVEPLIEAFSIVSRTKSDILWCLANFMTQNHSKKMMECVSNLKFHKKVVHYMEQLTLDNDNDSDIDEFSSICWFGQQYVQLASQHPTKHQKPDLVQELFQLNQHLLMTTLRSDHIDCGILSLSEQLIKAGRDIIPQQSELLEWLNSMLDNSECLQLLKTYLGKFQEKYTYFMGNLIKLLSRCDVDAVIHQICVQIIVGILINERISRRNELSLMILDTIRNDTLSIILSNCQWNHTSQYFLYLLIMDGQNRQGVLGVVIQQVKSRGDIISQLSNI